MQRSSMLRIAVAALVLLAVDARALAQSAKSRTATGLTAGDALAYDLSFTVGWRIDNVPDPLRLGSRLALEVIEDGRRDPLSGNLVLRGRLDVESVAYEGPEGKWSLMTGGNAARARVAEVKARLPRELAAPPYAERVAHAEERLAASLAALGKTPFRVAIKPGGAVLVTPFEGERLAAGFPEEAEGVLRAFLGQCVRFAWPEVGVDGATLRCDGIALARTATVGNALMARVEHAQDLPAGLPFSLESLLGARYGPQAVRPRAGPAGGDGRRTEDRPALPEGWLDLSLSGGARAEAQESLRIADRLGFVFARRLTLAEDLTGTPVVSGPRVHVAARVKWEASLVRAQLKAVKVSEPSHSGSTLGLPQN